MEQQYPHLFIPEDSTDPSIDGTFWSRGPFDSRAVHIAGLWKSALALSEEILLDRLLKRLLQTLLEISGAQRAFLMLEKSGELSIEAQANLEKIQVSSLPLEKEDSLPQGVIYSAFRTGETIILSGKKTFHLFPSEEYRHKNPEISLLAMPVIKQKKPLALLYLEHSLPGIFSSDQIEILKILASQAAVSIENALLYQRLQREMEEKRDMARMATLGELSTFFSHEIRNPLGAINLNFQKLSREAGLGSEYRDLVENIQGGIERIQKIMKGVLDYSRPLEPKKREEDLHLVLESALSSFRERIKQKNLQIEKPPKTLPDFLSMDPSLILQVFTNLIDNSIEVLEAGGEIKIDICREEDFYRISFHDTGPGIPADSREKIFQPFFSTKKSGFGLGLALSKKIVEAHGGKIYAESPEGGGATFFVFLPLRTLSKKLE